MTEGAEAETRKQVTLLIRDWERGDESAAETLLPLVYSQLRAIASKLLARERRGHTLQPTALVHEAYVRLVSQPAQDSRSRVRFLSIATRVMRQVLVDHARARGRTKRGGEMLRVTLDEGLVAGGGPESEFEALNQALDELAELSPRQGDVVMQRIFGGMTVEETAEALGVSRSTVEADWRLARAWLGRRLGPASDGD